MEIEPYDGTPYAGTIWVGTNRCGCPRLICRKLGGILLRNCRTPSLRPQATFGATANGRNRRSGVVKFGPEFVWDSWFVRSNRWAAMFPADAIPCPRHC